MIISKILGGLGNQLFQYAVARNLAEKNQTELLVDISGFQNYPLRKYQLERFRISGLVATAEDLRSALGSRYSARNLIRHIAAMTKWDKLNYLPRCAYITEKFYHFDSKIPAIRRKHVYLRGYWQSEKYFSDIEGILRAELVLRDEMSRKSKEFETIIEESESISVHVRRGDYVSEAQNRAVFAKCGPSYFKKAVEHISSLVKRPRLFLFSDDPDWVRKSITFDVPMTIVDHNGSEKDYEDLQLMAMCKHNIIVNSTFGWWGAWLNKNTEKVVVAPKLWFRAGNYDTSDLLPRSWVKI